MTDDRAISWPGFTAALRTLAQDIRMGPDVVVGVARGGLPGAVMLSHTFDAGMNVVWASHPHEENGDPTGDVTVENYGLENVEENTDVLLFDDIVDSGLTMQAITDRWDKNGVVDISYETASIHVGPNRQYTPDYWLEETDEWIVYPWEVNNE